MAMTDATSSSTTTATDDQDDRDGPEDRFDSIVVGLGVAGEEVAGRLVDAGWSVLGVEARLVGGECPYWGCVPSKMAIRAGNLLAEARRVDGMAGTATVQPDWSPVAARLRDATDDWNDQAAVDRFEQRGGTFLRGTARLVDRRTVEVTPSGRTGGGGRFRADRAIVLATGTEPAAPPIDGLDTVDWWTNRDALRAERLPGSLAVLGGGPIGCELAQVFARFGVRVTLVELDQRLLAGETPAAGEVVARVFAEEGITVRTGVKVRTVRTEGDGVALDVEGALAVTADRLLVATGRRSDLRALGVAAIGIDQDERWLPVDEHLRVTEGVWAVGDVTGKGQFTHLGVHQGRIAAADILGQPHAPADYRALPRVTFTDPEIGAVGLTPDQARQAGIAVQVGCTEMPSTARGWIHAVGNDGFVELVEDRARGRLVGATVAGPNGGEVVGLLTLAIHAEVPVERLRQMIYAYPTFHRGVEDALRDLADPDPG